MKYRNIDEIVSTTFETIDILKRHKNAWDALILYFDYIRHSRLQRSNKVFANRKFLGVSLWWGKDRLQSAKKTLSDEGLIEEIEERTKKGTIKYRVLVSFAFKIEDKEDKTVDGLSGHGELHHGLYKEEKNIFKEIIIKQENEQEKEQEKFIFNLQEMIDSVDKEKLMNDFYYKIWSEESFLDFCRDFFIYCETKKVWLKKSTCEMRFRRYLKPKWETDEDRNELIKNYNRSARKSRKNEDTTEEKKEEIPDNFKEIEANFSESEREEIKKESEIEILNLTKWRGRQLSAFPLMVEAKYKNKIKEKYNQNKVNT